MPAYNEERYVAATVIRCLEHSPHVFVIDDRSSDRTAVVAKAAGANVIRHKENLGYGGAIRTCLIVAKREKADCLVILDSDGQHDPSHIPALASPILDGTSDLVIGSRFKSRSSREEVPTYRMIGIQTITQVFNLGTNMALTDSQSGFRAYSKRALEHIKVTSDRMDASMEILFDAKDHRFRILEVPIVVRYKGLVGSSEKPFSHGFKVLSNTLKMIRERYPVRFFGWTGLLMIIAIVPVIIWSRTTYEMDTGFMPMGSMFIITFLAILGSFLVFVGVMLHGVNRITNGLIEMMTKRDG